MTMLVKEAVGVNVKMTVMDCPTCGMLFAVTADYERRCREDARRFYCPAGHGISFTESEVDRVRRESDARLARMQGELAAATQEARDERFLRGCAERSLSATKGVVTKMRNRAANGVCPCCSRHFTNLERHMNTKHPEFTKGGTE